jgi:hypothetical protein
MPAGAGSPYARWRLLRFIFQRAIQLNAASERGKVCIGGEARAKREAAERDDLN